MTKHTPDLLETACAKAIADPSYRTIKGILLAGTETLDIPKQGHLGGQTPAFLHGPNALFQTADTQNPHLATVVALPSIADPPSEPICQARS